MTKLELNDKLAKMYGFETFNVKSGPDILLNNQPCVIDSSSVMFHLMVEHKIILDYVEVYIGSVMHEHVTARKIGVCDGESVPVKDHGSRKAAAKYAIALALVKLAESK